MTISLWHQTEHPERIGVDLAIIGGGIAGLSAALEASRLGQRVVLLERHTIGAGASGRNAGFLMRGAADNYAAAIEQHGRDRAADLWRLTEDNLAELRAEGVDRVPGYAPTPSCLLALSDEEADELRASIDLLRADGFAAEALPSDADDVAAHAGVRFGLVNPNDAVCHPMRLLEWLAAKRPEGSIRLGEVVNTIEPAADGNRLCLRTNTLSIDTERVLVCANAWLPRLIPALAGTVVPNRGQMLALHAPSSACRLSHAYYANHGGEYFRRVDEHTIIVGGCRRDHESEERTDSDATTPGVQRSLESFAEEILGQRFPVITRWAGTMAFTPDHLPITGPTADPRVWVCGGFTGHGMSLGFTTARRTVDAMHDGSTPPFPAERFDVPIRK